MNKRKGFIVIFFVVVVVVWSVNLYHSHNSFKNLVLDEINASEITSIDILKSSNNENVVVKDKREIGKIIDGFADMKLRRSSADGNYKESYWISIYVSNGLKFGMRLTDDKIISITNLHKKNKYSSGNFKITSVFDVSSIAGLFK
jgi:hypothetical protein